MAYYDVNDLFLTTSNVFRNNLDYNIQSNYQTWAG